MKKTFNTANFKTLNSFQLSKIVGGIEIVITAPMGPGCVPVPPPGGGTSGTGTGGSGTVGTSSGTSSSSGNEPGALSSMACHK